MGDRVSDNRMAVQLLRGPSEGYKPFRTSVHYLTTLPSFDTLHFMLELKEQGNASDLTTEAHDEVHVAKTAPPGPNPSFESS